MASETQICIAEIIKSHGVHGQVMIRCYADDPTILTTASHVTDETGQTVFKITKAAKHKKDFLSRLDGINDRNVADTLRGTKLYITRDQLPDPEGDDVYYVDLIGRGVFESDVEIGKIVDVQDFGGGTILDIERTDGKNILLPYSAKTILNVSDTRLDVAVPDGLLELYD